MSVKVAGYQSADLFQQIKDGIDGLAPAAKKENAKKVNGIFQFDVADKSGKVQTWQLDLKSENGTVVVGAPAKADITIIVSDENFMKLSTGQLNGTVLFGPSSTLLNTRFYRPEGFHVRCHQGQGQDDARHQARHCPQVRPEVQAVSASRKRSNTFSDNSFSITKMYRTTKHRREKIGIKKAGLEVLNLKLASAS